MFASTVLLRRLFTPQPSKKEVDFHWWFVTEGIKDWHRFLASKGFPLGRRTNIIRTQEKVSRKILETWDTQKFRTWDQTGQGVHVELEIIGADAVPHIMSAEHAWGPGPVAKPSAQRFSIPPFVEDEHYH